MFIEGLYSIGENESGCIPSKRTTQSYQTQTWLVGCVVGAMLGCCDVEAVGCSLGALKGRHEDRNG